MLGVRLAELSAARLDLHGTKVVSNPVKDLVIGAAAALGTILTGALTLYFLWYFAVFLTPFIRAFHP